MSPFVGLLFDIVIVAALGVTIFYCRHLSRQFNEMQSNRKAFETLIQSLNTASSRAETVIRSLKEAAIGSGDALQEKSGRARALADELEIMIQAGDNLANRLQSMAEKGRRANAADGSVPPETEAQPRSRAEKELLEALKAKQQ